MTFLNHLCYSLAVAVVAGGLVHDHDVNEYRLATKRYHRKIRSNVEEGEFESQAERSSFVQPPAELLNLPSSGPLANETVDSTQPDTSFLLELPYPSHFLVSLQMLNLSLPFIETGITVPEDPPTPDFDLSQVITNEQFSRQTADNVDHVTPSSVAQEGAGRRRAVHRARHRFPARRLSKRSADAIAGAPDFGKPVKFRTWNASDPSSVQRRRQFANKLRSTTTARPTFLKKIQTKLLNRRANRTIADSSKVQSDPSPAILHQSDSSTGKQDPSAGDRRPDVGRSSNRFVVHPPDSEPHKTRIGGFRPVPSARPSASPTQLGPSLGSVSSTAGRGKYVRPQFGSSPVTRPETVSDEDESATPSHLSFSTRTSTTSSPSRPSARLSKYISQFHSASTLKADKDGGPSSQKASDQEVTQIQKPDTLAGEANENRLVAAGSSTDNDLLVLATSTTLPAADFVANPQYPSFELPSSDGSSTTSTLPPPLSIEELIKKFTGKDFVTDVTSTVPTPSSPQHPSPNQPPSISSTVASVRTTLSVPQLESFDDTGSTLQHLLVVTSSSAQILNHSRPLIDVDVVTSSPPSSSTTTGEPNFTLPVLAAPNWNPTSERTTFEPAEATSADAGAIQQANLAAPVSGSETSQSSSHLSSRANSTPRLETPNQPVSVQRGPLEVSFDSSFGSAGGQHQGGFNYPSSSVYPQQQFQTNHFGAYSGNFGAGGGGGGSDYGGQQNPYLYHGGGGGLFAGGGGQGQLTNFQNGFDGTLHYSPTGPPVGQSNAITQGLSLLASFAGSTGGHHFAIQPPASYQQAFNDFVHPSSLQASSQIQTTASFPSQAFSPYSQGYPPLNLAPQQPQSYAQSQPSYPIGQPASVSYPSQQQYAPSQQQSYQLVSTNTLPAAGLYPAQVVQYQQRGVAYQSPGGSASTAQRFAADNQATIDPSQFGTLLTGLSSADAPSSPQLTGTASVTSLTSSTSGLDGSPDAGKGTSIDAAGSESIEIRSKSVEHSIFADQDTAASQAVQLISIGPPIDRDRLATDAFKADARESLYTRGLRSGYYA